jgi:hypothetical protein
MSKKKAMLRSIIFLSVILISCTQNKQESSTQSNKDNTGPDSSAILNDPMNNLNIQTNSFSQIDTSGILMFPLSMVETESDRTSLSYKEISVNNFWNIIFFNGKTNDYHLLSDKKMIIRNYNSKYSSTGNDNADIGRTSRYIFYSITCDDFNKDKKLTDQDPDYLFVTDKEGNNFRQISPANYDLKNWQFIESLNKVLLTVKKDSDNNNKFDEKDEVTAFEVEIDKGTEPKEIFSTDFKNKLKILFDRDWRRLKE